MATRPKKKASRKSDRNIKVHLLDVGTTKYGECIVVSDGEVTVLIDGSHPQDLDSVQKQLTEILGAGPPYAVTALIVTHCHSDHIGCLPDLVSDGQLKTKWALLADEQWGFGHSGDADAALAGMSDRVLALVAAAREEDYSDLPDAQVADFLQDAAKVEPRYQQMIRTLKSRGATILRYGRDDLTALTRALAPLGFEALGPEKQQLEICARSIASANSDAAQFFSSALDARTDRTDVALYRAYRRQQQADAAAEPDRPGKGAALNSQSIVMKFGDGQEKFLLAGDMQFAKPELAGVAPLMQKLRQVVKQAGPYRFVKTLHHTSYNGLDESVLKEWGTVSLLAHSGGTNDPSHPDTTALGVLKAHADSFSYARTDRNGQIEVDISGNRFRLERGDVNDFTPNRRSDERATPVHTPGVASTVIRATSSTSNPQETIEIRISIPYRAGRVRVGPVEVEVIPGEGFAETGSIPAGPGARSPTLPSTVRRLQDQPVPAAAGLRLAAGRALPPLLFVTSSAHLAQNVGAALAQSVVAAIENASAGGPHELLDVADPAAAIAQSQERIKAKPFRGVVLVGGYDVLPAQRLDVLSTDMRTNLGSQTLEDDDNFIVWSDDAYGDADAQGFPTIPVSRIPDAHSPDFLATVLSGSGGGVGRFGIRNSQRPFAKAIFDLIRSGTETLYVSGPTRSADLHADSVSKSHCYFMLHGSATDGTLFWGERDGLVEAVNLQCVPSNGIGTVFAGCCWGALTLERLACRSPEGALGLRTADRSLALKFLAAGARAFVGCTGSHYSPGKDGLTMGAPLHASFWAAIAADQSPAQALHNAKSEYLRRLPHPGVTDPLEIAKEMKILREFTCLGLGW
jgi:beta-lactamase superfamily II metal-dependent hydrolase